MDNEVLQTVDKNSSKVDKRKFEEKKIAQLLRHFEKKVIKTNTN